MMVFTNQLDQRLKGGSMYITLFGKTSSPPNLTVHQATVKIEMGNLLIETDKDGFRWWVESILIQAANQGIDLTTQK